mgnify:CR=1 FL=1
MKIAIFQANTVDNQADSNLKRYDSFLENLDKEFCLDNQEILSQSRGAGYWLWKPQIILQELKKLIVIITKNISRMCFIMF